MKWKIAPFSYPNGIWGHCVAMTKDGDLYSTGGWSDPDPQASLKSNLVLSANGKREWSDRNSMNVGRGTHACLATHYKVPIKTFWKIETRLGKQTDTRCLKIAYNISFEFQAKNHILDYLFTKFSYIYLIFCPKKRDVVK